MPGESFRCISCTITEYTNRKILDLVWNLGRSITILHSKQLQDHFSKHIPIPYPIVISFIELIKEVQVMILLDNI